MTTAKELMRKDYVSVDVNESVSQLIGKCRTARCYSAVVFEDGKYLGMVERDFLLTKHIAPSEMKVNNAVKKRSKSKTALYVPTISPEDDLKTICKKMSSANAHALPVVEKNKVLGIVLISDAVSALADEYRNVTCDTLGSMTLITADPKDKLSKILAAFSRKGIDHLPIVDKQNSIIGILSFSDIIRQPNFWGAESQHLPKAASHQQGKKTGYQHGEKKSVLDLPAENFMSRKNLCCTAPETKVSTAIEQMTENDVCSIILTKNNKPAGILTMKDICDDYAR